LDNEAGLFISDIYITIKLRVMKCLPIFLFSLLLTFTAQGQSSYWSKVNSGTTKALMSVSFATPTVGYISGADSLLLKTTDGGVTWSPVAHTGFSFSVGANDIIHVNFINATTGFAVVSDFLNPDYQGVMYKTNDGGLTWMPVTSGNIAVYRTFFFDEHNGYQIGSAFFSGHTLVKLSGSTWGNYHSFTYLPDEFLYAIDFYDTSIGIAGGSGGLVYRSFDAGVTWDTVKTIVDSAINALKFLDHRTIVGACNDPMSGIIVSTDTGKTWQKDMSSLSFFYPRLKSLAVSGKDSFVAVGRSNNGPQGVILSWRNGFWNADGADQPMNSVAMSNDSIAFAVGDSGLIMSNRNHLLSIKADPSSLQYATVYPNPTTGGFYTRMPLPHCVTVTDLMGRQVYKECRSSKEHHINLSKLPKGIYTVLLRHSGEAIVTKLLLQ
jgi:photosystem II stability/assembly factor-like uncharacterized protein